MNDGQEKKGEFEKEPQPSSVPPLPTEDGNYHILVADDDSDTQELIQRLLSKQGYDVTITSNGKEAVQAVLGRRAYHLILMDINMPEMDGLMATRQIRAGLELADNVMPIIAITGESYEDAYQLGLAAGMNDVLNKPIFKANLYDIVERWLAKSTAARR